MNEYLHISDFVPLQTNWVIIRIKPGLSHHTAVSGLTSGAVVGMIVGVMRVGCNLW